MKHLSNKILSSETSAVATKIVNAFAEATTLATEATLSSIINSINSTNAELTEAILRSKVLSTLEEADALRDEKIHCIYHLIYGYSMLSDADTRKAAQEVITVFNKYGQNTSNKNYLAESGLIESMLIDFGTEPTKTDITRLDNLSTAVNELRSAQNAFVVAQEAYEKAKIDLSAKSKAYERKTAMMELINGRLIPYIDVMFKTSGSLYETFHKTVEFIIEGANATVQRRDNKPKDEPQETTAAAPDK